MKSSIDQAVRQLAMEECGVCRFNIGSAWFDQLEEYDGLERLYLDVVAQLTTALGEPEKGKWIFPEVCVEQVTGWIRKDLVVFAMLSLADNTRMRELVLGAVRSTTVHLTNTASYWEQPPGYF